MKISKTKMVNVIFYRIGRNTWITHDREYGIMRAYVDKKRKECVIAKMFTPEKPDESLHNYRLERMEEYPIYKNAKEAMKAICENLYNEEVK